MAVIHFTPETFEAEVINSGKVALVDFWASWCGPCKAIGPIIDELGADYEGSDIVIGKVDVDNQVPLARKYRVMSIPTIVAFKDGKEIARQVGLVAKEKLVEMINNAK